MGQQTRDTVKSYFQTGDVPSEQQYVDLIDSNLNIKDHNSGSIVISGSIETTGSGIFAQSKLGSPISTTNASFLNKDLNLKDEEVALSQTTTGVTALNAAPDRDIHFNVSGSTKMFLSSSGNVGIGTGTTTPRAVEGSVMLTVHGDISASAGIYASKIIQKGSNITLAGGHISMSGDIIMTGSVSASGGVVTDNITSHSGSLNILVPAGEGFSVGQTGGNKTFAIDAVTGNITSSGIISASGNVIAADVTIGALSIGKAAKGSIGNYGSTLDVGSGRAFTFQINSIPDIDGKLQSAKVPAKTIPTFIKNTSATADDIVVINCTTENLSATVFGQDTATAKSTPGFFVSLGNESDMAFNVGSASFTGIIL